VRARRGDERRAVCIVSLRAREMGGWSIVVSVVEREWYIEFQG